MDNTSASMYWIHGDDITYESILSTQHVWLIILGLFVWWEVCSHLYSILLESKGCSRIGVLTCLQPVRIPVLFERSDFHMVDNLSIVVLPSPIYMLTLVSIDKILLPKYNQFNHFILSCFINITNYNVFIKFTIISKRWN